jgi:fructosamine-3-kinase
VLAVLPQMLVLEWIEPGEPAAVPAREFGQNLARTHRAGAGGFGAPWPGYLGALAQDNGGGDAWPQWFAQRRLEPYLRQALDRAALTAADAELVTRVLDGIDQFAPPPEPAARLHGDLWPGNLVWAADAAVWLVDPAAHGGHRETDLASLALFGGAAYLEEILAGYHEVWPLAPGWPARVSLHQLHLLLAHAALFGGAYRGAVCSAATAVLRAG